MATIKFGSARIDERGKASGGTAGDQTGREVCTENYYMHSKGWYCYRPKSVSKANGIATSMKNACDNANIGYDQSNRDGVINLLKQGKNIKTIKVKTECDCSSLVRACLYENGIDTGNMNTATMPSKLEATGAFNPKFSVKNESELYNGDVLVSKVKGHTVIVVSGRPRPTETKTSTAKKSITEIAKEVIAGKWGNGNDRKNKLTKAGYNYAEVQKKVNSLLK